MRIVIALVLLFALVGCDDDPDEDAGIDSGTDAALEDDAGSDAGSDSGSDFDAGFDAAVACSPACGECEDCIGGTCTSVGEGHAISRLNSGWYHLLAIDTAGVLYVWGENDNGQLGLGDRIDRVVATPLTETWIAADGGSRHSCAVRSDGTLWCMGANVHGQLGNGDDLDREVPTQVAADSARDTGNPWVDVACGGLHTCALKTDGSVWCFGSAVAGQLGLGTPTGDVLTPMQIGGSSPPLWFEVASQTRHTCGILESDRSLHCWGDNSNGQIGQGDSDRDDRNTPQPVVGTTSIRYAAVRNGALHTCVIDEAGALDCFGANSFGQLGVGDTTDSGTLVRVGTGYADVVSGFEHSCAVSATGELSCWGNGASDQLGLGETGMHSTPQRVGTATDWARVVGGYYHSCGLSTDGTTLCWGDHGRGQQGGGVDIGMTRPTPGPVCFDAP